MKQLRNTMLLGTIAGLLVAAACDAPTTGSDGYEIAEGYFIPLEPGSIDPKAPPGWPLAIGDTISWERERKMWDDFEWWEGNPFASEVDGVYYRPKFERMAGLIDMFGNSTAFADSLAWVAPWDDVYVFVGYVEALTRAEKRALRLADLRRRGILPRSERRW